MSTILYFPEQPRPLLVTDIPDLWVEILRTLWNNKHRGALNMREVSQETAIPVHVAGSALLEMKTKGFVTDEVSPFWRYQLDDKGLWAIMSLVAIGRGEGFNVQAPPCVHENRDQAMSCPRYFDGTHGANHFSTNQTERNTNGNFNGKESTQEIRQSLRMQAQEPPHEPSESSPLAATGEGSEAQAIRNSLSAAPEFPASGIDFMPQSGPSLIDQLIARTDYIYDRETAPAEENNEDLGTIRFHHITGRQ